MVKYYSDLLAKNHLIVRGLYHSAANVVVVTSSTQASL